MNFYLILDGQRKKKPSVLCIITMTRKQNTYEYISPDKNVTGIFGHKYLPYFYMKEFQIFICSILLLLGKMGSWNESGYWDIFH